VVPFPRFPGATEKDTTVTVTVPDGLEVRGEMRSWDNEFAAWGNVLSPVLVDGKSPRAVTAITAKAESGLARLVLGWNQHRPDLVAEIKAAANLTERQLVVDYQIVLRSGEGFPRPVRFHVPAGASVSVANKSPFVPASKDEWVTPATENKEVQLSLTITSNLPPRPPDSNSPWKIPVGLLWPVAATRTDMTVRVWSSAANGRTISLASGGWRELSVEASPEKETLPALALAASGNEVPLVLDVREFHDPGVVAMWVERGLIQAWAASEAATEYRARFLLRRWLAPSVDIRLPGPLTGPNPEFRRDGLKIDAIPVADAGVERTFRIPLPAYTPSTTTSIEVRYQLPASQSGAGESVYYPPLIQSAAFVGPIRWQVTVPTGGIPLLTNGAIAEFRWRLRPLGLTPVAADNLDRWFRTGEELSWGDESTTNGETFTARQASTAPVTVFRAPRLALVIVCAVVVFVLVLALTRLPGWAIGPAVAIIGGGVGFAAVFLPHPAAQVVAASQLGVAAALAVILMLAVARLYYRRRITRLPGFARTIPEPSSPPLALPSSAAKKQATSVGSTGPIVPAGG
jgi:hypothetical protein